MISTWILVASNFFFFGGVSVVFRWCHRKLKILVTPNVEPPDTGVPPFPVWWWLTCPCVCLCASRWPVTLWPFTLDRSCRAMSVSVSRSVSHDSISFFFLLSLSPSHKRSKIPPSYQTIYFPPLLSNFPLSSVKSTAKPDRNSPRGQKSRLVDFSQILPAILSQSASANLSRLKQT